MRWIRGNLVVWQIVFLEGKLLAAEFQVVFHACVMVMGMQEFTAGGEWSPHAIGAHFMRLYQHFTLCQIVPIGG